MTELEVLQPKKAEKIDISFENLCYDVKIKKKLGFMKSMSFLLITFFLYSNFFKTSY